MRRQIIIYLGSSNPDAYQHDAASGEVSWIVQEPDNPRGPVFHGDLQTAANHALGCRVVVLVPSEYVLLTQVALPVMNRQRLVKAIPFALEETLASDVDDLHFAAGPRNDDEHNACAVVDCGQMDSWLAQLKEVNIQPDVVTSATCAVPFEAGDWSLLVSDMTRSGGIVLRTGAQSGLTLDHNNLVPLLRCFLENTETDQRPGQLRVIVCEDAARNISLCDEPAMTDVGSTGQQITDVPQDETRDQAFDKTVTQLGQLCDEAGVSLKIQPADDEFLAILVHSFNEQDCINLLQGEYSRKEQFEKLLRPWRAAAAIVFVWLLLQTGFMVAEYQTLASRDVQLRSEIVAVFRDAFPDAKNIVDPKEQMRRGLEKLQGGGANNNDIITLLAMMGEIVSDTSGMVVKGIRYKSDTLDVDIEVADLQALDKLKIRLVKEAGLDVEIVSASSRSGKVESRLKISAT